MRTTGLLCVLALVTIGSTPSIFGQASNLPLIQIEALEYEGAFSIPGDDSGESNANYPAGTITHDPVQNSLYLAGYSLDGAVAEFSIPELVNSTTLSELNTAVILQEFRSVLYETADSNPQGLDRISGLYLHDGKLIVNALEYYDAPADNTQTTLVIDDASALATSTVSGYYSLDGAAHASGWISDIPTEWQELLGGSQITGNSSKYSINGRLPMGISAFSMEANELTDATSNQIATTPLMDFDLSDPLYADYSDYDNANYNLLEFNGITFSGHTAEDADIVVGENDLWTEESQASYCFIVPGTGTYLCMGSSGGHDSGIGYKPTQSDGHLCGGPCPYDAADNYNYYWLWDVNELLAVKNGTLLPHEVRPYAHGEFEAPFQYDVYYDAPEFHPIVGGSYDAENGLLYLTIYDGASTGAYDRRPVIAAYRISIEQCVGDINSDGLIDVNDFLVINSRFGTACDGCSADLTTDGVVDVDDFVAFNSFFGVPCD